MASITASGSCEFGALTGTLDEEDVWLRIQGTHALAHVGPPARQAVPAMLGLAVLDDPSDPREFRQRCLGFCLLCPGGALGMTGLLARHRIAESMDLCLQLMEIARRGMRDRITRCLENLGRYGGAAAAAPAAPARAAAAGPPRIHGTRSPDRALPEDPGRDRGRDRGDPLAASVRPRDRGPQVAAAGPVPGPGEGHRTRTRSPAR